MNIPSGKNLVVSFKNMRGSKFNARILFVVVLACILLMDIWVIKGSVSLVLDLQNQEPPLTAHGLSVRVDFKGYDASVQRIQQAAAVVSGDWQASSSPASTTPPSNPFIPITLPTDH